MIIFGIIVGEGIRDKDLKGVLNVFQSERLSSLCQFDFPPNTSDKLPNMETRSLM